MIIAEFETEIKNELENFFKFWYENNKKKPEHFPLEMGYGDWFEQFIFFNNDMLTKEYVFPEQE